jgi:DNA polymerase-3 subunit delta
MSPKSEKQAMTPIVLIQGTDDFLRRKALDETISQIFPNGVPEMAVSEFDAQTADPVEVLDELRTLPFLAEKRVVIIRQAAPFVSKHRDRLVNYLKSPSKTGTLVLIGENFDGRTKFVKDVQAFKGIRQCDIPKRGKTKWLVDWVSNRAKTHYAKRLAPGVPDRLLDWVGEDLSTLDGELAKIAIYVGDRPVVDPADVQALVGHYREENVFGIMGAMAKRDPKTALTLWNQVWATDRAAIGRAIGGIAYSVRTVLKAKRTAHRGDSKGAWQPFWVTPEILRGFSIPQLQNQITQLVQADLAAKTGLGSVREAIEKFVIRQCHLPLEAAGSNASRR